jgi:hypothetical protein
MVDKIEKRMAELEAVARDLMRALLDIGTCNLFYVSLTFHIIILHFTKYS